MELRKRRDLGYRQFQILQCVHDGITSEGRAPSYGMIANALGMTKGDVCRSVQRLEKRALLSRVGQGKVRRIRLA